MWGGRLEKVGLYYRGTGGMERLDNGGRAGWRGAETEKVGLYVEGGAGGEKVGL
jgi:hypothetical protein